MTYFLTLGLSVTDLHQCSLLFREHDHPPGIFYCLFFFFFA
jgi:hypothetical protein